MADTTHKGYTAAIASALTTELNSLATAANTAASSAIDNTSTLDLFMDLELVIATMGTTRSAGARVEVYIVRAVDGTNYDDVHQETADLIAVFPLDAAVTARRQSRVDIPIAPGMFKLFARNVTGQTLAASGNTLKARYHSVKTV